MRRRPWYWLPVILLAAGWACEPGARRAAAPPTARSTSDSSAAAAIAWKPSFEDALAEASRTGKPLLVNLGALW